ncbi:MAG: hypothetical protein Q4A31_07580 [Corynebacterium sp.]|uniref:hypothetical protein n=1 Tax=Corynebacterium sp. TaxID=1720 RepID=UPI0026DA8BC2|nr:hypothetical protein [Corynebacterium sp.]MDO4761763.1 hypothetical protein [Corynebacterium sp.]
MSDRDVVLRLLGDVWRAHPDMSVHGLFTLLLDNGLRWDTSDADAAALLHFLSLQRPARVEALPCVVLVDGGARRVVVDTQAVVVLGEAQVTWFRHEGTVAGELGTQLVVDGVHRLGVVERIVPLDAGWGKSRPFFVAFESGACAVIGRKARVFVKKRREVEVCDCGAVVAVDMPVIGQDVNIVCSQPWPADLGAVSYFVPIENS